ncbi:MAG: hypothetical protein EXX96DRAFT_546693 [Benjaminiella poitrasii]|nr:MAG: hypothetical protein EXX96DRAFT_546693 [Benjaminiella poitrasii]
MSHIKINQKLFLCSQLFHNSSSTFNKSISMTDSTTTTRKRSLASLRSKETSTSAPLPTQQIHQKKKRRQLLNKDESITAATNLTPSPPPSLPTSPSLGSLHKSSAQHRSSQPSAVQTIQPLRRSLRSSSSTIYQRENRRVSPISSPANIRSRKKASDSSLSPIPESPPTASLSPPASHLKDSAVADALKVKLASPIVPQALTTSTAPQEETASHSGPSTMDSLTSPDTPTLATVASTDLSISSSSSSSSPEATLASSETATVAAAAAILPTTNDAPIPAKPAKPAANIRRKRKLQGQKVVLPVSAGNPLGNLVFEEAGDLSYAEYLDPPSNQQGISATGPIVLGAPSKKRKITPPSSPSLLPSSTPSSSVAVAAATTITATKEGLDLSHRSILPSDQYVAHLPTRRRSRMSAGAEGSPALDDGDAFYSASESSLSPAASYYTASEGSLSPIQEPETLSLPEPTFGFWGSLLGYFRSQE